MPDEPPDFWKKLQILLAPVGGLLTAISVALIGFIGSSFLNKKQETDTRSKVFAELMSQREQAESVMRKDLFAYVRRHLPSDQKEWLTRLDQAAADVVRNQLLVLEEVGQKFDCTIDLNALNRDSASVNLAPERKTLAGIERVYHLVPIKADIPNRKLQVRLEITTLEPSPKTETVTFWVNYYDFPMIDNTRMSYDQRYAVVMYNFCETSDCSTEVTVVIFPGSRASLQEKTF